MLTKIYFALWAMLGVVTAILFLTGTMTMFIITVIGFISFGMVFMGMMGVLPIEVSHDNAKKPRSNKKLLPEFNARQTASRVSGAVASYLEPARVPIGKVRHP